MTRNRKARLAGATLALLLMVVALLHLGAARRRSPGQRAPVGASRADADRTPPETLPAPAAAGGAAESEPGEVPGALHVRQARLIESIDVEPAAPCRDQEVLVTVHLVPDARGSKVFVAGMPGSPAVLRFPRPGPRPVQVVARDWYDRIQHRPVETMAFSCDGTAAPVRRTGDAGQALSSGAIAAGNLEKLRLSIPVDWLGPDACRAQVWLRGRAGPAEVRVPLALELGVPAARVPVTDPGRLALLAKAARALGGTRFTVEDLARVQAMGPP